MKIFNTNINTKQYSHLFSQIIKCEKQNIIFTPNPEILLQTLTDSELQGYLDQAHYLTADGIGLYIAFQIIDNSFWKIINTLLLPYFFFNLFFRRSFLYKKYGDRICGSDLTQDLVEYAQNNNIKIAIIDLYNPSDINKVASQQIFPALLTQKFPGLIFDYYVYNPADTSNIISAIQTSNAQILFSTLWMKKQEASVIEIMEQCSEIKIWLGIGSSFDYFIWFQKRAPKIWRSIWLEWFYRLLTGPRKITRLKRLWKAIFMFTYMVITYKK